MFRTNKNAFYDISHRLRQINKKAASYRQFESSIGQEYYWL